MRLRAYIHQHESTGADRVLRHSDTEACLAECGGLLIAGGLSFLPFVRARRLVFTVAMIGALSCLYIAGEEMSLRTEPPQAGQISTGGSENFWIRSKRCPQCSHSYS